MTVPTRAIVLFAHGSRDPLWSRPMERVAQRIQERDPAVLVQCAFLEMMAPDLPGAVRTLVAAGAHSITVLPMFLGVGRHAREDLPRLMQALAHEYPQTRFQVQPVIGDDPRLVDLMAAMALS